MIHQASRAHTSDTLASQVSPPPQHHPPPILSRPKWGPCIWPITLQDRPTGGVWDLMSLSLCSLGKTSQRIARSHAALCLPRQPARHPAWSINPTKTRAVRIRHASLFPFPKAQACVEYPNSKGIAISTLTPFNEEAAVSQVWHIFSCHLHPT